MRSRHSKLVRTIAFAGVPLLAAAAIFGACNYHWYPYGTSYQFNKMEFVSAYPAVKKTVDGADRWVRVCGNDVEPTGVLLALNLLGTQPDKSPDTSVQVLATGAPPMICESS